MSLLLAAVPGPLAHAADRAAAKAPDRTADTGLSPADLKRVKDAAEAVDQRRFARVDRDAASIKDPAARHLVEWLKLTRVGTVATFSEYAAFIEETAERGRWPRLSLIRARAEESMGDDVPHAAVLAWHEKHGMRTGPGKARLAEALIASGQKDKALPIIREAWINGDFTKSQETAFYKRFRKQLSADDHAKRMERLLWDNRHGASRRMLSKVSRDQRLLAEAKLSLMRREGNVDTAISRVPQQLQNDPGLEYERLRWRRRKGKGSAFDILKEKRGPDLVRPEKWWQERAYLTRLALTRGRADDAYRFASGHSLTPEHDAADRAEAEWLSGWIALRYLKKPEAALTHFDRVVETVAYPISVSRAHYWRGRALEQLGRGKDAEKAYEAAAVHGGFFYGQLAAQALSHENGLTRTTSPVVAPEAQKTFNADERVRAARILVAIDEKDDIRPFIIAIMETSDTPAWQAMTAELATGLGRTDLGVHVAKVAERTGTKLTDMAYPMLTPPPLPKNVRGTRPERALVLAMIRQESAFHVTARSRANALGLMQILPGTARKVAQMVNLNFSKEKLTGDATYNLTLGQSYLSGLIDEFGGSYIMAVAAYNAGPARVRQWVRNFGDPRKDGIDPVDWIENIPFEETRDYVQRVLENLQVYRQLLKPETRVAFNLLRDLKRP